jgi:hypothetical protein
MKTLCGGGGGGVGGGAEISQCVCGAGGVLGATVVQAGKGVGIYQATATASLTVLTFLGPTHCLFHR